MKSITLNSKINILTDKLQIVDKYNNCVEFNFDEAYLIATWVKEYLSE